MKRLLSLLLAVSIAASIVITPTFAETDPVQEQPVTAAAEPTQENEEEPAPETAGDAQQTPAPAEEAPAEPAPEAEALPEEAPAESVPEETVQALPDFVPLNEQAVTVEAESGTIVSGGGVSTGDGNFTPLPSGGSCVRIWENNTQIDYTVSIPQDGLYQVKVYGGSRAGNSATDVFEMGSLSGKVTVPDGTAPNWQELAVTDSSGGALATFALTAGAHTFSLKAATAHWCYYDKFEFIRVGDLPAGPDAANSTVVEAESAGTLTSTGDGNFLALSGSGCVRVQGAAADLTYKVSIPSDGLYNVWVYGGSRATDSASDRLSVNGADYAVEVPAGTAPNWAALCLTDGEGQPAQLALKAGEMSAVLHVSAHWCYYDKIVFEKVGELPAAPFTVQAEDYAKMEGSGAEKSDNCGGHFPDQAQGGGIRMNGQAVTLTYTANAPAAGWYDLAVYVGSSADADTGRDKVTVNGTEYNVVAPGVTKPNLFAAPLTDGAGHTAGPVWLEKGDNTLTLTYESAAWCYYDRFEFTPASGPAPAGDPLTVEAEAGAFTAGKGSGFKISTGDGNFNAVSAGSCVRMLGGAAKLDYSVTLPEDGLYTVTVYAGSRADNSGTDTFALDGAGYELTVPAGASPEWAAVQPVVEAELEAGTHTFSIEYKGAAWCYYDKIVFEKVGELPDEPKGLLVEAEAGYVFAGASVCGTDAQLNQTEGNNALRITGENARVDYSLSLTEGGLYRVHARVGRRAENSGTGMGHAGGQQGVFVIEKQDAPGWNWVALSDGQGGEKLLALEAGEVTFMLTSEVNWCYYDKFVFEKVGEILTVEQTIALIEALPAPENMTTADRAAYENARFWYDALEPQNPGAFPQSVQGKLLLCGARLAALDAGAPADAERYLYEFENGAVTGTAAVLGAEGNMKSYSGTGYVWLGDGSVSLSFYVPRSGRYDLYLAAGSETADDKCDNVTVNGGENLLVYVPKNSAGRWVESQPGRERYTEDVLDPQPPAAGFELTAGWNTITVKSGWGYSNLDYLFIQPADGETEGGYATLTDVVAMIEALPQPDKLTAADVAAVQKAYQGYLELTDSDKAKLTAQQLEKLLLCSARANALARDPNAPANRWQYEFEDGAPSASGAAIVGADGNMKNFSGRGYAYIFDGSVTLRFYVPQAGTYRLNMVSGTEGSGDKCDYVTVNGGETLLVYTPRDMNGGWNVSQPGRERYLNGGLSPQYPASGFWLNKGWNTIVVKANWGYSCYDAFYIEPFFGYDYEGYFTLDEVEEMAAELPWYNEVDLGRMDTVKRIYKAYLSMKAEDQYKLSYRGRLLMCNARINALMRDPDAPEGRLWYELEEGRVVGNTARSNDAIPYGGYSGSGYVYLFDKGAELDLFVPESGTYNIYLVAGTAPEGDKCDYLWLNQTYQYMVATHAQPKQWVYSPAGVESYLNGRLTPAMPEGGIYLEAGYNFIELVANWGYNAYDALIIEPGTGSSAAGASSEAVLQIGRTGPGWPGESTARSWEPMDLAQLSVQAGASQTEKRRNLTAAVVAACAVAAVAGVGVGVALRNKSRQEEQEG